MSLKNIHTQINLWKGKCFILNYIVNSMVLRVLRVLPMWPFHILNANCVVFKYSTILQYFDLSSFYTIDGSDFANELHVSRFFSNINK